MAVEMTAFFAFARHLLCPQGYYIKSTLFILMITESTLTAARPQSLIQTHRFVVINPLLNNGRRLKLVLH